MKVIVRLFTAALFFCAGCTAPRSPEKPAGRHFKILTYNVNWGVPGANDTIQAIRQADADIVCLQETNHHWERLLQHELADQYPHQVYRESVGRMGGGLAFLSKKKGETIAYVRSVTGWFDGWAMRFPTQVGHVQVLNVHLQPQVEDDGQFTLHSLHRSDAIHIKEIQRFHAPLESGERAAPVIVAGDFNEGESGGGVRLLESKGFTNALPEFDRCTPTWAWDFGLVTWRLRLDHVMYERLYCFEAKVIKGGVSDHQPVLAVFGKALQKR